MITISHVNPLDILESLAIRCIIDVSELVVDVTFPSDSVFVDFDFSSGQLKSIFIVEETLCNETARSSWVFRV